MCAQENSRKLKTNKQEIKGFFIISYLTSYLTNLMNYWPFQVTGNASSILWKYKKLKDKDKFKDILQNLHFSNNTETVKNDNAEKVYLGCNI